MSTDIQKIEQLHDQWVRQEIQDPFSILAHVTDSVLVQVDAAKVIRGKAEFHDWLYSNEITASVTEIRISGRKIVLHGEKANLKAHFHTLFSNKTRITGTHFWSLIRIEGSWKVAGLSWEIVADQS